MKKFAVALFCFGTMQSFVFGQATRPRVAATPAPPAIENDPPAKTDRRPPVLMGDPSAKRPLPASTPETADDGDVIKIETNLITMPVSVLDRDGRFVSGLGQNDFRIFDDGIEQKVDYFQSVEQPFTVILMIDVSPSTAFRIEEIHGAANTFINQLRPNDKVMVIAFDESVQILCRPTTDKRVLRTAINSAQFGDGTSLYEAVDQVLSRELRQIEGRKAVVLFTDGVDTTSRRATYQSTVADVEEVDALFYPVRYNTQQDNFGGGWGGGNRRRRAGGNGNLGGIIGIILGGGTFPPVGGGGRGNANEYETGRKYLDTLAQNSGGRSFEADSTYNLEASFASIAEELRRQYSLGYYPEKVGSIGDRKQIKVRVMRPGLVVRAKTSYIVGQNNSKLAGT
ncbi:MAG: VWA domain-containing protein [Pyrinomonadaceae bacterium]